jgi:hypothetical protein
LRALPHDVTRNACWDRLTLMKLMKFGGENYFCGFALVCARSDYYYFFNGYYLNTTLPRVRKMLITEYY